jgi:CRP-like cAMP-binding protein
VAEEPRTASDSEPEISIIRGENGHAGAAPLDTLVLAERLGSEQATQAAEIELDTEMPDPFEAPRPQRGASPLSSPLLGSPDNESLRVLIENASVERFTAGQVVFNQGEEGDALYIILQGEVSVERHSEEAPPRQLATLRAGSFFGEMALITNDPRSATVSALGDCELLVIKRPDVQRFVEADPEALLTMLRFFRARIVGTLVQTAPLFKGLSLLERRGLVSRFRLHEIPAGSVVIREGQPSDGLNIALAGKLLVVHREASQERVLAHLSSGDIYGEMSLLTGGPAVATIRAETKVWVLTLPRRDFEEAIRGRPAMRQTLERLAAERRAKNDAIRRGEVAYSEGRIDPM